MFRISAVLLFVLSISFLSTSSGYAAGIDSKKPEISLKDSKKSLRVRNHLGSHGTTAMARAHILKH